MRLAGAVMVGLLAVACGPAAGLQPSPGPSSPPVTASATPSPEPTPAPSATGAPCAPTDQDAYSRTGTRLLVKAACIRVTGTVEAVIREPDGDRHIQLRLDPGYENLLIPGNAAQRGDLLLEAVCVDVPTQADAIAVCRADPNPLRNLPSAGQHIWVEGRYVIDVPHGWAELHPIYRWAPLP